VGGVRRKEPFTLKVLGTDLTNLDNIAALKEEEKSFWKEKKKEQIRKKRKKENKIKRKLPNGVMANEKKGNGDAQWLAGWLDG